MTTTWLLLLVNIAATWCCSTIHVSPPDGATATVIGRTMELNDVGGDNQMIFGGLLLGVDPSTQSLPPVNVDPWTISVHRRDEVVGEASVLCGGSCKRWKTKHGYVSVDLVGHLHKSVKSGMPAEYPSSLTVSTDGMNEKGLTVSTQIFTQSVYMKPSNASGDTNVCFAAFAEWLLGTFESVNELREALPKLKIVLPRPALLQVPALAELAGLHWSIDDASEHAVLEVIDGVIMMHNNTVGTFTNQPDFAWHLRNLNNFVNLRSDWPRNPNIQVQTEVGAVPSVTNAGHGFNLLGMPGDYSPPSRFVRLFYLREYAVLRFPPKKLEDSIALATGLLNNVFINKGTVPDPNNKGFGEFTQYAVLKVPSSGLFFYNDYVNTQWRMVSLGALDFSPKEGATPINVPLVDPTGSMSIKNVTASFTAPASGLSTCKSDDADDLSCGPPL